MMDDLPEPHKLILGRIPKDLEGHLSEVSCDVDAIDEQGRTALWWAAALGKVSQVKTLLRMGAAIDMRDVRGWPPITAACMYGKSEEWQSEMIELLLSRKPDLNAVDSLRRNLLHNVCWVSNIAIQCELIKEALKQGVRVDDRDSIGGTPLMSTVSDSAQDEVESGNSHSRWCRCARYRR